MNNPLEILTKVNPANKALAGSVFFLGSGVGLEVFGFSIDNEMSYVALGLGVVFTFLWILLLYKQPPPEQNRRESDLISSDDKTERPTKHRKNRL